MNQEDRELLNLAANAAGYVIDQYTDDGAWAYEKTAEPNEDGEFPIFLWRPRHDDGDALRLAARLEIDVLYRIVGGDRVECIASGQELVVEYHNSEPYVATRRAIVRAAAAIGKSMKETNHG